jgi:hypothetical protein
MLTFPNNRFAYRAVLLILEDAGLLTCWLVMMVVVVEEGAQGRCGGVKWVGAYA